MCQVNVLNTKPREAFIDNIIGYSDSDTYDKAITEWIELSSGPLGKPHTCICGQRILKGSHIYNTVTRSLIVIGFNCRDKYIRNIENVSCKFVTWLYEKHYINEWENGFLRNISTKTGNYSPKQKAIYIKINTRILNILTTKYSFIPITPQKLSI